MQPNNFYSMYPRPCAAGEFIFVQGPEMARTFPVAPGNTVRFIDMSSNYMYVKRVPYEPGADFDFIWIKMEVEEHQEPARKQQQQIDTSNFVTVEQFNSLNNKLDSLLSAVTERKENNNQYQYRKNKDREKDKEAVQDVQSK